MQGMQECRNTGIQKSALPALPALSALFLILYY